MAGKGGRMQGEEEGDRRQDGRSRMQVTAGRKKETGGRGRGKGEEAAGRKQEAGCERQNCRGRKEAG